jgi:hypothetical protein
MVQGGGKRRLVVFEYNSKSRRGQALASLEDGDAMRRERDAITNYAITSDAAAKPGGGLAYM